MQNSDYPEFPRPVAGTPSAAAFKPLQGRPARQRDGRLNMYDMMAGATNTWPVGGRA